jgi:hypothetical protein
VHDGRRGDTAVAICRGDAMSRETNAADDPRSEAAVDVTDPAAVRRWTEALGVTDEALMTAVLAVGTRIDRIKDYLGSGGMAGDQEDA